MWFDVETLERLARLQRQACADTVRTHKPIDWLNCVSGLESAAAAVLEVPLLLPCAFCAGKGEIANGTDRMACGKCTGSGIASNEP